MLLYAIISYYMLLYAIICDYMLLYAIICFEKRSKKVRFVTTEIQGDVSQLPNCRKNHLIPKPGQLHAPVIDRDSRYRVSRYRDWQF